MNPTLPRIKTGDRVEILISSGSIHTEGTVLGKSLIPYVIRVDVPRFGEKTFYQGHLRVITD